MNIRAKKWKLCVNILKLFGKKIAIANKVSYVKQFS